MEKPKLQGKKVVGIKAWAESDRPREKLVLHGRRRLTNAELLAIILRTGFRNETAVDLGKGILAAHENDLAILSNLTLKDLTKFRGMGEAKAVTIIAALELGRRRKELDRKEMPVIKSSIDGYEFIKSEFADLNHEEFWILLLNRRHKIICKQFVSKGGQAGTVVDPKVIFKSALDQNASAIILVHNHPSGNLQASSADINITQKLVEAGRMLEIPVLDHLIIADHSFLSLADEKLI